MDGAFPQDFLIVAVQRLGGDGLHIGNLTQTGDAKGVLPAHLLQKPVQSVGPLVVALGLQRPDQVLLFRLHIVLAEAVTLRDRVQQDFLQKGHHGSKDRVAVQREAVIDKAAGQAGTLDISDAAHQRPDGCPVQVVQPQGDGSHIRAGTAAP